MARRTVYTGGALAPGVRDVLPPDNDLRTGKVLSVTGNVAVIDIAGGTPTCAILNSYSPHAGETVYVLRSGPGWLVLGSAVPASGGAPAFKMVRDLRQVSLGADMSLTAGIGVNIDITGVTLTTDVIPLTAVNPQMRVYESMLIAATLLGVEGRLKVALNNVIQPGYASWLVPVTLANRNTISRSWVLPLTTGVAHTVKMVFENVNGTLTLTALAAGTALEMEVIW